MGKNSEVLQIGANIRKIRKGKKISLEKVALGTKMSISFLSLLECGKANVSVENLKKIADFLNIKMVSLFEEPEANQLGTITRKGKGLALNLEDTSAYCESMIRKSGTNLQATLYINPPGEGRKTPMSHIGEEMVYVTRGKVTFHLNDQIYQLNEGDLMHYRSEAQHWWINPGKFESVMIIVNTPPNW